MKVLDQIIQDATRLGNMKLIDELREMKKQEAADQFDAYVEKIKKNMEADRKK